MSESRIQMLADENDRLKKDLQEAYRELGANEKALQQKESEIDSLQVQVSKLREEAKKRRLENKELKSKYNFCRAMQSHEH